MGKQNRHSLPLPAIATENREPLLEKKRGHLHAVKPRKNTTIEEFYSLYFRFCGKEAMSGEDRDRMWELVCTIFDECKADPARSARVLRVIAFRWLPKLKHCSPKWNAGLERRVMELVLENDPEFYAYMHDPTLLPPKDPDGSH